MLAQRNRLRKASEFALASKGTRVSGENFLLHVRPPSAGVRQGAPVKVGLIVGKNVGGSVIRHRISRQIRHAIAPHIERFSEGTLVVVRANPGAGRTVNQNISGEISSLISRYFAKTESESR
jgi:ribonuclease P protein component